MTINEVEGVVSIQCSVFSPGYSGVFSVQFKVNFS